MDASKVMGIVPHFSNARRYFEWHKDDHYKEPERIPDARRPTEQKMGTYGAMAAGSATGALAAKGAAKAKESQIQMADS